MGRTGKWFAFEHFGVTPDVICLGKGVASGFPISACVASKSMMSAWGPSRGEAKHTSTFLGSPLGCAMIVATINELRSKNYLAKIRSQGAYIEKRLRSIKANNPRMIKDVRGRGLMLGLEFKNRKDAVRIMKGFLKKGVIILTSGEKSEVLSFTPPFIISRKALDYALNLLQKEASTF